MFKEIWKKIKILAVAITVVGVVLSISIGLAVSDLMSGAMSVLVFFAIAVGGSLVFWVSSFCLYAFGELVENTYYTRKITEENREILKEMLCKNGNDVTETRQGQVERKQESTRRHEPVRKKLVEEEEIVEIVEEVVEEEIYEDDDVAELVVPTRSPKTQTSEQEDLKHCPRCGERVNALFVSPNVGDANGGKVCRQCLASISDIIEMDEEDQNDDELVENAENLCPRCGKRPGAMNVTFKGKSYKVCMQCYTRGFFERV